MIYLDNSATTAVREEVKNSMLPYLAELGGNPSSIHKAGIAPRSAVENARAQIAALIGCAPVEVSFTPCATYSNNVAILGRARAIEKSNGGKHLITSVIEHPSCLGPAKYLEANGWEVTYLTVDRKGLISAEQLRKSLKPTTSIVSLMWANNEIGSVFPVEALSIVAKDAGAFFHTDAVQVPGKLAIDVKQLQCDTLSLSGHKFYAPKGVGVLYRKDGVELEPIFFGGGQEHGLFPGTEAVPNIVAIGTAAALAMSELESFQAHLRELQRFLMGELSQMQGVSLTGPDAIDDRLPGHVSIVVEGIEGEAAIMQCDLKGLLISSASACHKGVMQPSHVVSSLGISDELALGSLRISVGRGNTIEDCQKAVEVIRKVVTSIRRSKTPVR